MFEFEYDCRRCRHRFVRGVFDCDPDAVLRSSMKPVQWQLATEFIVPMNVVHNCAELNADPNSKEFGVADLVGCKKQIQ